MIQWCIYSLALVLNFIFLQMSHPLAMGFMLLVQTTMICLMTGVITKTFWFSYILFLIFLGGMLVLFIYVTSLASNEMFSMSTKLLLMSSLVIIMFITIGLIIDKNMISLTTLNLEMTQLTSPKIFNPENSLSLIKLYNFPSNITTILLMNYLLITLIAVVKITKLFYGPLRNMN